MSDTLREIADQLCDCADRSLNGRARELANELREKLLAEEQPQSPAELQAAARELAEAWVRDNINNVPDLHVGTAIKDLRDRILTFTDERERLALERVAQLLETDGGEDAKEWAAAIRALKEQQPATVRKVEE